MPSWAWVVTAKMSNILNFSWYFLCIPAIYRFILAYLPIFFNQLSKFLRCESPSTFLGTCLSHHSFIIFLVTNTNTLLSGLHLISTLYYEKTVSDWIGMCQCPLGLIPHFYKAKGGSYYPPFLRVNALSGLYLISTVPLQKPMFYAVSRACFCRYLSEYSDNSCFSCMLTFWTYLMRCTYPWHWIKYSTKYNRCHPIFSLSWQVELSSNTLSSRAAAQTPLHKMYTFVYRTFIKFILFCRGQALFLAHQFFIHYSYGIFMLP